MPRLGPALVSLTATVALVSLAPPPASAAGEEYVALGDSYSSGLGTRSYLDDGSECRRSTSSYAGLIAAAQDLALNLRACSGATVPDVASTQLDALSGSTSYVTISVGGNDAGFADVLTECALPAWASDCAGAVAGAQAYVSDTLPGALGGLYSSIRSAAPAAQVVVVGYPRVFMGEDCNAATFFSPEDEALLNQTADQLNGVLASAASGAGFAFADPTSAFTGHAVCDDPAWLNGFSSPIDESYHPNVAGHADGYAPLVAPLLTGSGLRVTADVRRDAAADAPAQTREQRRYADRDAVIEQDPFRAPPQAR
ncbi:SGNH/GDSL hydrolase family protein [Nocardioides lianchengensis]|uniref:SGNH/GDSL hydrolase family protein n=1 Tax=Nocardioides lianchengensis TaxID=1045774 RepID=UPI000B8522F6|nr:SGNH/GDSL hydrolase family protein [Nocardioides lianchengensis]NYG12644.1 lysophospholipase L1-like esterase [Nocardioides lianchengensis]